MDLGHGCGSVLREIQSDPPPCYAANSLLTGISSRSHSMCRYLCRAMRKLVVLLCSFAVLAVTASFASAADPTSGTLSVERGKGVVMIDLRGSVLGRLTTGIAPGHRSDAQRPLRAARHGQEAHAGSGSGHARCSTAARACASGSSAAATGWSPADRGSRSRPSVAATSCSTASRAGPETTSALLARRRRLQLGAGQLPASARRSRAIRARGSADGAADGRRVDA